MLVEYSLYSRPRRVRREGEGKGREGTTYPVFLVLIDFTCHQFSEPPSWEEERRERKREPEKKGTKTIILVIACYSGEEKHAPTLLKFLIVAGR